MQQVLKGVYQACTSSVPTCASRINVCTTFHTWTPPVTTVLSSFLTCGCYSASQVAVGATASVAVAASGGAAAGGAAAPAKKEEKKEEPEEEEEEDMGFSLFD